ncbi:MAG TPA: molecular chaperone SurA, partial [Gammaproteobacteria bacterium]|nr:molecular chaperone SurA [Gammaproteobacteria bacterium]
MRKTSPIPVLRILAAALLLFVASASATPAPLNRIVAVVNDGVIVQTRLDQRIRRVRAQIRQKGIALPPGNVLRRKVLDRMVMEKIQLQLAARTGIQVDDNTLNHALRSIARRN